MVVIPRILMRCIAYKLATKSFLLVFVLLQGKTSLGGWTDYVKSPHLYGGWKDVKSSQFHVTSKLYQTTQEH